MDLEQLRAALDAGVPEACQLDAGVHDVTRTFVLSQSGVELRSASRNQLAVLRRGRLPDGSLFEGPLVSISGCRNVRLASLVVDGRRFEECADRVLDNRHPADPDPASVAFPCGSTVEADVLLGDCSDVVIDGVLLRDPVTIGLAIGPGCRDIAIRNVQISRAGQLGLWIGSALPGLPPRPLPGAMAARLPAAILAEDCEVSACGAAGVSVEGHGVTLRRLRLDGNHRGFPFNDSGGQLVIDYKSDGVRVEACEITGESCLERPVPWTDPATGESCVRMQSFAAVGIEASGSRLEFADLVVRGMAREALHVDGAHCVRVTGRGTRLEGNHRAARRGVEPWRRGPRNNITLTTSAGQAALGMRAGDIEIDGIYCEDGILVWSDGSLPGWRLHGLAIASSDFGGAPGDGVAVGLDGSGRSLRGEGWRIER